MHSHERAGLIFGAELLSGPERLVLLALSHHLGGDSAQAWPSRRRLGSMTGLSRATVSRALRSLEDGGMVSSSQRCGSTSLRSINWGGLTVRQGGLTMRQGGAHSETQKGEEKDKRKINDRLAELWTQLEDIRGSSRRMSLEKRRASLRARVKEHGEEAVLSVWRWVYKSDHHRALFLRQQGYGPTTILRPSKFEDYLRLSAEPVDQGPALWAELVKSLGSAQSIHPPGRRWRILPDDAEAEALILQALVSALQADGVGSAWMRLRRLNTGQLRSLERRFVAAVRGAL